MAEQVQILARVEPEIKAAMDNLRETEGIMLEHQMRMGCLLWLESKGINPLKKPKATSR